MLGQIQMSYLLIKNKEEAMIVIKAWLTLICFLIFIWIYTKNQK